MSLDGFARVDAFATSEGQHPHTSPADLLVMWDARRLAAGRGGVSLDVSRLQHAYLTAALGVNGGGQRKDVAQAQLLADLWHWWSSNVRGRIWQPPPPRLHRTVEPPRRPAPNPLPEAPTAGHWLDAEQQHGWWDAARRDGGGHPARKQVQQWTRVRDAAAPIASSELHAALALVDVHDKKPFNLPPAAPVPPRHGKW